MSSFPVGRLAPSPTGAQHVGNARTYLISWLSIRSRRGNLFLRIEDIDSPRIKKEATSQLVTDLQWLGLNWDGEPIVQSNCLPIYRSALRTLQEQELVYPCTCTRSDIEHAASAPHAEHEGPIYPGTCAKRRVADAQDIAIPHAWRFRASRNEISFLDRFRGHITVDATSQGGDFVVWKSDGTPAYQLAVVVDDARMGISEVVRGDDLIPSTPRQIQLYECLGHAIPEFVHVPLVVGPDGRRLAKRHGDTRLSSLRDGGVPVHAFLGLLAWSCGWLDRPREVDMDDLLPIYDLQSIPKRPFVLQDKMLRSIGYET